MTVKTWVKENWSLAAAVAAMAAAMVVLWYVVATSPVVGRVNPKTIEYIGDTTEGWRVYRVRAEGGPSGYVVVPPK